MVYDQVDNMTWLEKLKKSLSSNFDIAHRTYNKRRNQEMSFVQLSSGGFYRLLLIVYLHFIPSCLSTYCVNSEYTQLLETGITRLKWQHLAQPDISNLTMSVYIDDEMCHPGDRIISPLVNHRSLCPWEVERDYDENRYPDTLYVAKCKCSRCLGNYECKPVIYRIPVLIKSCENNVMHYTRISKIISVGCTCIRPIIHTAQKRNFRRLNMHKAHHPHHAKA